MIDGSFKALNTTSLSAMLNASAMQSGSDDFDGCDGGFDDDFGANETPGSPAVEVTTAAQYRSAPPTAAEPDVWAMLDAHDDSGAAALRNPIRRIKTYRVPASIVQGKAKRAPLAPVSISQFCTAAFSQSATRKLPRAKFEAPAYAEFARALHKFISGADGRAVPRVRPQTRWTSTRAVDLRRHRASKAKI